MNFIGKHVAHTVFGTGLIKEQTEKYITVVFEKNNEEKKFQYPSCFKSFLKLEDSTAAKEASESVKEFEEAEVLEKERKRRLAGSQYFNEKMLELSSGSEKTIDLRTFATVSEFCDDFMDAVGDEAAFLKNTGGRRKKVYNGTQIEIKNKEYIYTFSADEEPALPEGTPVAIWDGDDRVAGTVIGCEDFTIILASTVNLGMEVPVLEFSAEPWRLLEALVEHLDVMKHEHSKIVTSLVCEGRNLTDRASHSIAKGQEEAVHMSKTQPITFIWGPPGTGKTQTLAKIVLEHINIGRNTLMLSQSNAAVDGAIIRVSELAKEMKPGTLVRYGYPRDRRLLEHEYLTSYNLALHKHPGIVLEKEDLEADLKKFDRSSKSYVEAGRRLQKIREMLRQEEKDCVKKAAFTATTVSKAVVDSAINMEKFDVVIFDEASMAYIPQIVFSAGLAKKHFICMGDFRQLPPIVQGSEKSHLHADIFEYCGIASAVDHGFRHPWLCMLDVQYRMHPHISDFSGASMYQGMLKSAEDMEKKRQKIVDSVPARGEAVAFADLSGMMSVCRRTKDRSKINVLSALISFSLAMEAAKEHETGIITPYRAQSKLLHAMAVDLKESVSELHPIACATVHQFQGSEKDVILYDAVDCYRMTYPGKLLIEMGNNYANRLFNVALTRAKGKFIGVANIDYMRAKKLSKSLLFERMMQLQVKQVGCLKGTRLTGPRKMDDHNVMRFFAKEEGYRQYLEDLLQAEKEVRIDIPTPAADSKMLEELVKVIKKLERTGRKVYIRAEKKKNLPEVLKPFAVENHYAVDPVTVIDQKLVWFGLPWSEAYFVADKCKKDTLYRPVIRFDGVYTARSVYSFLDMDRVTDLSEEAECTAQPVMLEDTFSEYVLAHERCPSCNRPMRLKMSRKGKYFLACTGYPECEETALIRTELVERYLYRNGGKGQLCPKCHSSLEPKLGPFGIYVQCCGDEHHSFKIDEI